MRELIVCADVTLDGFMTAPRHRLDFMVDDDELDQVFMGHLMPRADTSRRHLADGVADLLALGSPDREQPSPCRRGYSIRRPPHGLRRGLRSARRRSTYSHLHSRHSAGDGSTEGSDYRSCARHGFPPCLALWSTGRRSARFEYSPVGGTNKRGARGPPGCVSSGTNVTLMVSSRFVGS